MVAEPKPRLSIEEVGAVLKGSGVDVFYCVGPDGKFFLFPTVQFMGDDSEGRRAVEVLQKHGILIFMLRRQCYYDRGGDLNSNYGHDDTRWEILL